MKNVMRKLQEIAIVALMLGISWVGLGAMEGGLSPIIEETEEQVAQAAKAEIPKVRRIKPRKPKLNVEADVEPEQPEDLSARMNVEQLTVLKGNFEHQLDALRDGVEELEDNMMPTDEKIAELKEELAQIKVLNEKIGAADKSDLKGAEKRAQDIAEIESRINKELAQEPEATMQAPSQAREEPAISVQEEKVLIKPIEVQPTPEVERAPEGETGGEVELPMQTPENMETSTPTGAKKAKSLTSAEAAAKKSQADATLAREKDFLQKRLNFLRGDLHDQDFRRYVQDAIKSLINAEKAANDAAAAEEKVVIDSSQRTLEKNIAQAQHDLPKPKDRAILDAKIQAFNTQAAQREAIHRIERLNSRIHNITDMQNVLSNTDDVRAALDNKTRGAIDARKAELRTELTQAQADLAQANTDLANTRIGLAKSTARIQTATNAYDILGLKSDATRDQVLKAYGKLHKAYNPETPLTDAEKEVFANINKKIDRAYQELSNPEKASDASIKKAQLEAVEAKLAARNRLTEAQEELRSNKNLTYAESEEDRQNAQKLVRNSTRKVQAATVDVKASAVKEAQAAQRAAERRLAKTNSTMQTKALTSEQIAAQKEVADTTAQLKKAQQELEQARKAKVK